MKNLGDRVKKEQQSMLKQERRIQRVRQEGRQCTGLDKIKYWTQDVEPLKLIKLSEELMSRILENWSKFRLNVLKHMNEEQSKIIDIMARLRKQVQWLNQLKTDSAPQLTKLTSKLYKDFSQLIEQKYQFNIKSMMKQSKLITDKITDTTRVIYEEIRLAMQNLHEQIKQLISMHEILQQKTYFRFLKDKKHSQIILYDPETISCKNQSYDMDFGIVVGPALTQTNNKIGLRIQTNDKYQCFIGVGICHVKEGSGPGSGSYLIKQQNNPQKAISLNHKYQKYGSLIKQRDIGWGFGEGDTILVQIDFQRSYVCFSKGNDYYQMPIDVEEGPLAGYVVFRSKWDCVTIINS